MTNAGVDLGHMDDQIVGTSNAGAVTQAYGVKVQADSYGLDADGEPVVSLSGKATAVINSGFIAEPGTGVFLADAEAVLRADAASAEGDNRIYLDGGDNTVILGTGDRVVGAEGSDRFFTLMYLFGSLRNNI